MLYSIDLAYIYPILWDIYTGTSLVYIMKSLKGIYEVQNRVVEVNNIILGYECDNLISDQAYSAEVKAQALQHILIADNYELESRSKKITNITVSKERQPDESSDLQHNIIQIDQQIQAIDEEVQAILPGLYSGNSNLHYVLGAVLKPILTKIAQYYYRKDEIISQDRAKNPEPFDTNALIGAEGDTETSLEII